ncbi:WXG100 family type VII secretion target [Streptomyces sp. NPDC001691]|uniref:WXG100 family type VII secretion target n=1 Tax=unclassified Streptomyces TaxID=2593676 RepID=UPI000DEA3FFB|nr:WXG100 family type VII secretion target [Streptomyces sp. SDr-06]RCH61832.1 WXG100 family type VII secretion target [Streptomyces sp. SDr-06]
MPDNSGDVLGVHYGSLTEAAESIRKQAGKLQQDLEDIRKLVDRAANNWHGQAHEVYATKQRDWTNTAQSVQTSLTQIANAVAEAGPTYRAGDHKAAGYFQ